MMHRDFCAFLRFFVYKFVSNSLSFITYFSVKYNRSFIA